MAAAEPAAEHTSQARRTSRSSSIDGPTANKVDLIVGRSVKTRLLEKINAGSFGEIFEGELLSNGNKVAVKLEHQNSRHPQLLMEGSVYRHLEGGPGIPHTFWYGMHEPLYNVLVMELLGPSLQDLFVYCERQFSLKTVLMLIDQMLDTIDYLHKNHYIHRDIKPDNFMIGRGQDRKSKVFLIDYGLAKKYSGHRVYGHHHYHFAHTLVGTARFASIHAHLGHEEGQRDDLESLAYVWIYFLKGKLPWQGLQGSCRREKFQKIKDLKLNTPTDILCSDLPPQIGNYLDYSRHLRAEEPPDYSNIKQLFASLATDENIVFDSKFDWMLREEETGVKIVSTKVNEAHLSSS